MSSPISPITIDRDGGIVVISLNRPDKGNGLNRAMCDALQSATRSIAHDASVTAVVLRANGPRFCVGGDIAEFAAAGDDMANFIDALASDLHDAMGHLQSANAPTIAAVRGACAGAGIGMAVGCDLVVAGESASFTIGYPGVGLSPDGGSSFFLSRIVGLRRAMEMIVTNRTVLAPEAKEWGLVNEVVADADVDDRAMTLAKLVSKFPTGALGAARRLVMDGASSSLADAFLREEQSIARLAGGDEAKARVTAFLDRSK